MILKALLNTRMIYMIFIKILKNTTQIKNLIVTELFIRVRKLNISLVLSAKSYFAVPKNISLNSMHYFITKILNKRELQKIAFNQSLDIDFKVFMNLYKKCNAKPYSFLVNDATPGSDNPFCFRKNLLEKNEN